MPLAVTSPYLLNYMWSKVFLFQRTFLKAKIGSYHWVLTELCVYVCAWLLKVTEQQTI